MRPARVVIILFLAVLGQGNPIAAQDLAPLEEIPQEKASLQKVSPEKVSPERTSEKNSSRDEISGEKVSADNITEQNSSGKPASREKNPGDVQPGELAPGGIMPGEDPQNRFISPFVKHLAGDQRSFWTAPWHLHARDVKWIAPFGGITAAFIASDSWMAKQIPSSHVESSRKISDYATYSLAGGAAGSFLWGKAWHNDHLAEAGLLSGEAALNAVAVDESLALAFQRQRPDQGNGHGNFFQGGFRAGFQGGGSFPSAHSAVAWAVASVWAHEYPSPFSKTLAYAMATAVTITRVTARQHFPSDAVIGSALGWYFGREVYRAHHDRDLGGGAWGSAFGEDSAPAKRNLGSAYVPIDSWIYPAFDRLIALGVIHAGFTDLRPWTRLECARLLAEPSDDPSDEQNEARDAQNFEAVDEAEKLLAALTEEFKPEAAILDGKTNAGANLDSIYTRSISIAGPPLNDGFHFGQTVINDYGRPYSRGFNAIAGFTTHAEAGPFSVSVQSEYQHAPAVASEPLPVLQATAAVDSVLPNPDGIPEISRLRLVQGAAGIAYDNLQISFGQQSLWWGPGNAGPFLFSNNSEPMTMLRFDSVSPYEVPLASHVLGPMRSEFFIGRLSGQDWSYSPQLFGPGLPSQPWLHGTKLSFHPTQNLEFSMGFTAQFGGTGNPFTWARFLKTFYSHRVGIGINPGKRLSEFDFRYRIPGMRNWVTLYLDSMVIDEYSPIGSTRPAINPGLYLPRLPNMHQVDLRMEGVTTDLNVPGHFGPGAFYWDERYRSGYTNNGNIIGDWVGRRGRGEQAWLTYHFSPRTSVQLAYRNNSVDKAFLQGGGLRDWTIRGDWMAAHNFGLSAWVQQENWHFPTLLPAAQSNVVGAMQLTFWPQSKRQAASRKPPSTSPDPIN
jgi:membrane-associated phospholipid phosphatase